MSKPPSVLNAAVGALALAGLLMGCSTYQTSTRKAQDAFYVGDFNKTAELLKSDSEKDGKDQVLYLFDRGTALQLAGNYKESERDFLLVDKLTEIKDYTSLSTEAATLLTSDKIKQYKGEDFEKVLISAYLAIDYVLQNNYEDALVECRRVNNKLEKYRNEAKRNYEQNPFARYLSGMIWEASGHDDDAYIDYKEAAKIEPNFPYLKYDLFRLAKKLERDGDLRGLRNQFGSVAVPKSYDDPNKGEVVLIYQQGLSAVKRPRRESARFPQFVRRYSQTQEARLEVSAGEDIGQAELSQRIYGVSDIAVKTLDDAYAGLVAKRVAGVVAKAVIADQIAQRNQLLGFAAFIGLNAMDQADLRSWQTLPDTIQIARLSLSPGKHALKAIGLNSWGQPTGESALFPEVNVEKGKKVFINWRSLR